MKVYPADAVVVAVLGASVTLANDGKELLFGKTGLSEGSGSYASAVAVASVVVVTDAFVTVFCCTVVGKVVEFVSSIRFATHVSKPVFCVGKY